METTGFKRAYLILWLTLAWLCLYPLWHAQVPWLQTQFRTYHPWRALQQPPPGPTGQWPMAYWFQLPKFAPVHLRRYPQLLGRRLVVAPVHLVRQDSLQQAMQSFDDLGQYHGQGFLASFRRALSQSRGQVRIGHFGDSSIEGDLITQTLRDSLQRRFGGQGIGLVGISNPIPGFRQTVRLDFSKQWHRGTITSSSSNLYPFGISGEYFRLESGGAARDSSGAVRVDSLRPATAPWTSLTALPAAGPSAQFSQARLFYGRLAEKDSLGPSGKIWVKANGREQSYWLWGDNLVNAVDLTTTPGRKVQIYFSIPSQLPLYGVSLESPTGVIVDNFSMRGNTGQALLKIKGPQLSLFQNLLEYDLVILQFGLNVINPALRNYQYYQDEMVRVIRHFQTHLPKVPILVVGPSDKAYKTAQGMVTDPSIPRITRALRMAAQTTGVGFFSLYEAMGGAGSMVEWVEQRRPRLANLDYTHFNTSGAGVAGQYLVNFLLNDLRQQSSAATATSRR